MAEQKMAPVPPSFSGTTPFREPQKSSRLLYGLVFYAGAVTAAVVILAVLGAMYVNDLQNACAQKERVASGDGMSSNRKTFIYDDQEFEIDEQLDREILKSRGESGHSTVVVHDFRRGITGVYDARAERCYLIGGIDENVPPPVELRQLLESDDRHPPECNTTTHAYASRSSYTVKDLSELPTELQEFCWDKDVFWLQNIDRDLTKEMAEEEGVTDTSQEGGRQKRDVKIKCYDIGPCVQTCCYCYYCACGIKVCECTKSLMVHLC